MPPHPETLEERLYRDNLELNRLEYQTGRIHLWSRPRCLGVVLGNACNVNCIHCYQAKNGDHLLRPPEMGHEFRRELAAFYPYLSTLRILGGEVLALKGFPDLIEDLRSTVNRPILSISTNGTLLDDQWAETMVHTPFLEVTVSIDGATHQTMARLRGGTDLDTVLNGLRRVLEWKRRLRSELPLVNTFFVIMRSNFREIPAFLLLMRQNGVTEVALQTLEINPENTRRHASLERDESISSPEEVRELHDTLRDTLASERPHFRMIRVSGLEGLFRAHGLETEFLFEQSQGLYPDSDDLADERGFECCPNPWTTLFVGETGSTHLCFLSEAIGNLYEAPLATIWNSPMAVAKRSLVITGRYSASGCSRQWCGWRDGQAASPREGFESARTAMSELSRQARIQPAPSVDSPPVAAVRRAFREKNQFIAELESRYAELSRVNDEVHRYGQQYIDDLEARIRADDEALSHGQRHIDDLEARLQTHELELRQLRARPRPLLPRAAAWLSRAIAGARHRRTPK